MKRNHLYLSRSCAGGSAGGSAGGAAGGAAGRAAGRAAGGAAGGVAEASGWWRLLRLTGVVLGPAVGVLGPAVGVLGPAVGVLPSARCALWTKKSGCLKEKTHIRAFIKWHAPFILNCDIYYHYYILKFYDIWIMKYESDRFIFQLLTGVDGWSNDFRGLFAARPAFCRALLSRDFLFRSSRASGVNRALGT